jgi:hypothetical protein
MQQPIKQVLRALQTVVANSRCNPPCDTCRQLTDTTWYTRQTPTDKGVYTDASGNSLVIKSTTPDSKGYYCSANGLDSSNTFWRENVVV